MKPPLPVDKCAKHRWSDNRPCPTCRFGFEVGVKVRILKCLYPCVIDQREMHGGAEAHVGVITDVFYADRRLHPVRGVFAAVPVAAVQCPKALLADKIIYALEVEPHVPTVSP